ncbi:unnamed protein product [Pleuronectes platessa]|uniref:Uncharacterized protein n=1 Tax=Pleuronectes platessa TaxID=8262 RepID=A0A9N7TNL7_PLEPL|nr:unnamed protein product [Pleuronectes platessa]
MVSGSLWVGLPAQLHTEMKGWRGGCMKGWMIAPGKLAVMSRCRRPPYPVPSNRSPPSAAPTDTAPRHTRRKAPAPRMSTSPPKKTSRRAAHRASGGVVRRATGRLLPQPQDVPSGLFGKTPVRRQAGVFRECGRAGLAEFGTVGTGSALTGVFVGSAIHSLTHLHAEVSLGKMLNP